MTRVVKFYTKVNDIKLVRYNADGNINYTFDFNSDYQPLPRTLNKKIQLISTFDFPQLHTNINHIKLSKLSNCNNLRV